ncbi:DNA sulfur modification protein DndE [Raoultella ornithinolytica]|uniref:DNA sulfur modification protein DndE n=1 Tax=Raoultella ornithinolytica TaxID=54291 RepID=UPI001F457051|nr:DNA sulfur modification protein DndE [Raoultella ornithinolytica]MCF6707981.1 DNA sulfur modification protein DndE [Raoultella ornithinolytica]MEB5726792.1 DNA sulfur modification protein DndE [Raoultella ornithinolytica]
MLPNRMQLSKETEEQLKRLKIYTGLTPNISARLAFFRSIESSFRYSKEINKKKLDGTLVLDKITWLGESMQLTELALKMLYKDLDDREYVNAWAAHVEDGIASLRNYKSLNELCNALN